MSTPGNALEFWSLQDAQAESFGSGLINDTYLVTTLSGEQYILQGLNPVFSPEVNVDIDRLTKHLEARGRVTQRLLTTNEGQLWAESGGRFWRLSTYVPGVCLDMLETDSQAAAAGRLLGHFHAGVRGLQMDLHTGRLGVHDTARHLRVLEETLLTHAGHRYFSDIEPLAHKILAEAEQLPTLPELPDRLVHGDPKISNLVFDAKSGEGICMIDLDTLTYMPLPLELGDAFRSWCNPRGEDTQRSAFRLDLFSAAIGGYAEVAAEFVTEAEWRAFVPATCTIMIELAARFATDALNESYFGWNPEIFPDRSTHNQVRATGQLILHRSLSDQFDATQKIVEQAFSR
jgi:Ser/Thr protein kinase RdoA (MazF antagonist)